MTQRYMGVISGWSIYAVSWSSNSFANRLSSFSYVDSYIFRPQLLWRTTQPVERDTERYTERDILVWSVGLVRSGRNFTPSSSNCDLKVATILILYYTNTNTILIVYYTNTIQVRRRRAWRRPSVAVHSATQCYTPLHAPVRLRLDSLVV